MNTYTKSPMLYMGNKYKLLPQLFKLFPDNINNFYDIFCGGCDISINIHANKVYANDKHSDLIWLLNQIKTYKGENLGKEIFDMDKKYFPMNTYNNKSLNTFIRNSYNNPELKKIYYKLMDDKRKSYYSLRDSYNKNLNKNFKIIMLLILNSIGIQSFGLENNTAKFSCGNLRVQEKTINQINTFKNKLNNINLSSNDFRYIKNIDFKDNDFVYLDPPYLNTSQYKTKWTIKDEQDLYDLLDFLDNKNVKFALSNFKDGVNHTNEYLSKWCKKYNIHNINDKHTNLTGISKKNNRQEILVTNY